MERKMRSVVTVLLGLATFLSVFVYSEDSGERVVTVQEAETCDQQTKEGDYLVISYTGKYTDDGEQFYESGGDPVHFKLGEGKVLPAWERGLNDMCVGEVREIFIPADATEGHPLPISGGVVPDQSRGEVSYSIELIKILDKPPTPNLFKKMDFDGDNRISKTEMLDFIETGQIGGLEKHSSLQDAVVAIFKGQDGDSDGYIDFHEFSGPKHDEL